MLVSDTSMGAVCHERRRRGLLVVLLLLLFSIARPTLCQPADPNDPSTWNITSCSLTNLTATAQSLHLTLNTPTVNLLYIVLPSSAASSSLYVLSANNPNYVDTIVSSAPVTTDEYMALYTSATNVSDPSYHNNTVIVAGTVSATGAAAVDLSLSLPPSSVFTIFYLLANSNINAPLYTQPLTQPVSTNVTVPAACISPPTLDYCVNLDPSTLYASYMNPFSMDTHALALYTTDLALYSPSVDCSMQQSNVSICYDCLAIQQRWRCATTFSGCTGNGMVGGGYGGPCRWLCQEKNNRCNEAEDCSVYALSDCNGAAGTMVSGGVVWMLLMLASIAYAAAAE